MHKELIMKHANRLLFALFLALAVPGLLAPVTGIRQARAQNETETITAYGIHLSSYHDIRHAQAGWPLLQKAFGEQLGGLGFSVMAREADGKSVFWLVAGPMFGEDLAKAKAEDLRALGQYARVVEFPTPGPAPAGTQKPKHNARPRKPASKSTSVAKQEEERPARVEPEPASRDEYDAYLDDETGPGGPDGPGWSEVNLKRIPLPGTEQMDNTLCLDPVKGRVANTISVQEGATTLSHELEGRVNHGVEAMMKTPAQELRVVPKSTLTLENKVADSVKASVSVSNTLPHMRAKPERVYNGKVTIGENGYNLTTGTTVNENGQVSPYAGFEVTF